MQQRKSRERGAPQNNSRKAKGAKSASPAKRPIPYDDDHWDVRLGYLMHDVSRLRRVVFDNYMRPLGITRSQWWVLSNLSRHDGMIQSDLAVRMDLGKAALGGLVDRLEASAFLERRPEPADRRAKRIYLAPKGEQIVREMRASNQKMSDEILKGLSDKQRRELADMLALVKANLLSLTQR